MIVRIWWPMDWFEVGEKRLAIYDTDQSGMPSVAATANKIIDTEWALLVSSMGSEQAVIDSLGITSIYNQREET